MPNDVSKNNLSIFDFMFSPFVYFAIHTELFNSLNGLSLFFPVI